MTGGRRGRGAPTHSRVTLARRRRPSTATSSSGCRTTMGAVVHAGNLLTRSGHSLIVGMRSKGGGPGALLVGTQERCAGRPAPGTQGPHLSSCLGGAVQTCRPLVQGGLEGRMEGVLDGGTGGCNPRTAKIHSRRQRKSRRYLPQNPTVVDAACQRHWRLDLHTTIKMEERPQCTKL